MYPRFGVEEVNFRIDEKNVVVSLFGNLPIFKTDKFEKEIKAWLVSEMGKRN